MFYLNTPAVRELDVWSSMPEQFRKTDMRSVWADANQGGKAIDSFLEGPVFDSAGNLYVTDIPFGRIFKITPQGLWSLIAEYDGEPNGMKFLDANTLLITDYKNGLIKLDVHTGAVTPFLARRNTESFKGVNDLTIAKNGDIYFTDQGQTGLHDPTGRVYRYAPQSGKLDLLLNNVPSPNGIVQLCLAHAFASRRQRFQNGAVFHQLRHQRPRWFGDGRVRALAGCEPWPGLRVGRQSARRSD
jgi:gluconolactonase